MTCNEKRHVVMFSGGAGSWATAKRVAAVHGTENLYLVFADTLIEDEDLYRFIKEAAENIGGTFVHLVEGRTPWEVFHDDRFLGNSRLANCSKFLKQRPARKWLEENCNPENTEIYVGIDWTETHRMPGIIKGYLPWRVHAPMCDEPLMDKSDMIDWLRSEGIEPPRLYELGFAHNNCGGFCVRSGQAQFEHLLRTFPERYAEHERQEQSIREHLGKNVSILRDRTGGSVTPLTLRRFREKVQEKPELFDKNEWGGCGCFFDDTEEHPSAE